LAAQAVLDQAVDLARVVEIDLGHAAEQDPLVIDLDQDRDSDAREAARLDPVELADAQPNIGDAADFDSAKLHRRAHPQAVDVAVKEEDEVVGLAEEPP